MLKKLWFLPLMQNLKEPLWPFNIYWSDSPRPCLSRRNRCGWQWWLRSRPAQTCMAPDHLSNSQRFFWAIVLLTRPSARLFGTFLLSSHLRATESSHSSQPSHHPLPQLWQHPSARFQLSWLRHPRPTEAHLASLRHPLPHSHLKPPSGSPRPC